MGWGRGKRGDDHAACAEAREVALLGAADVGMAARVARHVARCAACQAEHARLDALRAAVRTDPAPLDDLTRARILDRLTPALDDLAATRPPGAPRPARGPAHAGGATGPAHEPSRTGGTSRSAHASGATRPARETGDRIGATGPGREPGTRTGGAPGGRPGRWSTTRAPAARPRRLALAGWLAAGSASAAAAVLALAFLLKAPPPAGSASEGERGGNAATDFSRAAGNLKSRTTNSSTATSATGARAADPAAPMAGLAPGAANPAATTAGPASGPADPAAATEPGSKGADPATAGERSGLPVPPRSGIALRPGERSGAEAVGADPGAGPREALALIRLEPRAAGAASGKRAGARPGPGPGLRRAGDGVEGAAVRRLVLAAGTRERARLGDRTHLLLVGPAELEVIASSPELLEVILTRGTLVGHYRHGAGGRLRIRSPGTRTDVVGTTFYVEAQASGSRVAVSEGRVLVRDRDDHDQLVSAGQIWSTPPPDAHGPPGAHPGLATQPTPARIAGRGRFSGLPRSVVRLFAEHGAGLLRAVGTGAITGPPGARATRRASVPASDRQAGATPTLRRSTATSRDRAAAPASRPAVALSLPGVRATGGTDWAAGDRPTPAAGAPPDAAVAPSPAGAPGAGPGAAPPRGAADLYRRAEEAMARGDAAEARRRLLELAVLPGTGALGAVASYELAQLALRAGDLDEARTRLDRVRAQDAPDLAEPAAFLACEIELRAGALPAARGCYTRFRARHPGSVQDAEALGALLRLSSRETDCSSEGRALLEAYLAHHPTGPLATEARRRREACRP